METIKEQLNTSLERIKPLKIQYNPEDAEIFFTADLHFGHTNIINFCNRPFKSVEEMDKTLVDNWNKVVRPQDKVFILGDFAFATSSRWKVLLDALYGAKYLILGNHDISRYPGDSTMDLFNRVEQQMILKIDGRLVYLNHYPFMCYAGTYNNPEYAVYELYGHVHSTKDNYKGKDKDRLIHLFPYQYDVGVDNNNYTPVRWSEIKNIIETRINN